MKRQRVNFHQKAVLFPLNFAYISPCCLNYKLFIAIAMLTLFSNFLLTSA